MTPGWQSTRVLAMRELKRLTRQPSRLISAILTPIIFWLLAGAGLASSFQMPHRDSLAPEPSPAPLTTSASTQPTPDATPNPNQPLRAGDAERLLDQPQSTPPQSPTQTPLQSKPSERPPIAYSAYLLPGMATMVVMFASVLGSISLIQDRQAGFLQSVLVGPAPRWSIVAAKVIGGGIVAVLQATLLIILAAIVGLSPHGIVGILASIILLALISAGVIGVGLALAWRINSVSGFHGIMNLVLLPMWVLSGALFPASGAHPWLATLMAINPLHWSTLALGGALGVGEADAILAWLGFIGTTLFAAAGVAWACLEMRSRVGSVGAAGER